MGIIDDIGSVPLAMAEGFYNKGYYIWVILGLFIAIIWIWGR